MGLYLQQLWFVFAGAIPFDLLVDTHDIII